MEQLQKHEELVQDVLNFIEIIIHHYLYRRQVYPSEVFQQRTMYGILVQQVKKGVLYEYINELVEDIKKLLNHTQIIRINLESDGEIREHLDIDIDKSLRFEDMKFIPPKNERDTIFQKLLFHLDQKMISILGYDFTENYYINSFNVQIITDGSQDQYSQAKHNLLEKWLLEKKLDEKFCKTSQMRSVSQSNQQSQQKMQEENQDNSSNNNNGKKDYNLIDSFVLSEFTIGLFHMDQKAP